LDFKASAVEPEELH